MREPSTGKPSGGGHPVGESQNQPFQLSFNRFLRVDFQGLRVTSDGGLLLVRELDERLGLTGQRIERSELIRWGEVSAGRPGGGEKPIKPVSGTAQRARLPPNERPGQSEVDTRGWLAYGFAQR